MWNKFEASSIEDETLGSSFYTNGLFKISNDEEVIFQNNPFVVCLTEFNLSSFRVLKVLEC